MAISMYSAAQASKAKAEEEMANNVARTEKRRLEFNRDQQTYLQNLSATKRQETSDLYNINIAAAEAQDSLAMARAGSGLSGASMNELDDEITRAISSDQISVHRGTMNAQDQLEQQRIGANENRQIDANQARTSSNPSRDIANAAIGSLGQGIASMDVGSLSAFSTKTGTASKGNMASNTRGMYSTSAFIA